MSSIDHYLDTIGSVALLDADEERMLGAAVQRGRAARARVDAGARDVALYREIRAGARAAERFVLANTRLVVAIARRYPAFVGLDTEDLIQEGNLGLMHAVEKFDPARGFRFSTYASFWIRQAIGRAINHHASTIRIPEDKVVKLRGALAEAGAPELLQDDLYHLWAMSHVASLDRPVGGDEGVEPMALHELIVLDAFSVEDQVLADLEVAAALEALAALDERPRTILQLRFGLEGAEPMSWPRIGRRVGMSTEAARRLAGRTLEDLRAHLAGFEHAA